MLLLINSFKKLLFQSALPGGNPYQFLVIICYTQTRGEFLTDLPAAAPKLSANGYYKFICHKPEDKTSFKFNLYNKFTRPDTVQYIIKGLFHEPWCCYGMTKKCYLGSSSQVNEI